MACPYLCQLPEEGYIFDGGSQLITIMRFTISAVLDISDQKRHLL